MAVNRPSGSRIVAQTMEEIISWRPALAPVLRAFEPLLTAQSELAETLADNLPSGVALPEADGSRLGQGVSLLAGVSLDGAARLFRQSAETLLPLLECLDFLKPHMPALKDCFLGREQSGRPEEGRDERERLAEAVIAGNREAVAGIAEAHSLEPLVLEFVAVFVIAPVLRAMVRVALQAVPDEEEAPWNEGNVWQQGYCPVCGSLPSIGWLDKPRLDEKNAFLAGGGGKKHLHCGLCGADWNFRRSACPFCGQEGNGVIEILRESGVSHGERLEWCTKCKSYCPNVDLRERESIPDLEATAMGMMHLDMVAARKKLRPIKPSFWNIF